MFGTEVSEVMETSGEDVQSSRGSEEADEGAERSVRVIKHT